METVKAYVKVKPEYDQRKRSDGSILVADELYTPAEAERLKIPAFTVEPVIATDIYWFFGARFGTVVK